MNGLADLGWALLSLLGATCFLAMVIADRAEIGRRLGQGAHLLAGAVPWLAAALSRRIRGEFASPSAAHPAAGAVSVRGWGHLSDEEALEFDGITSLLKAGVLADEPQSPAPRSDS